MRGRSRREPILPFTLLLALLPLLVACPGDGNVVVLVELRTDLVPGVEVDSVRTELSAELPRLGGGATTVTVDLPVTEASDFSHAVRVAELEGVPVGVYYLTVKAIRGVEVVAERTLTAEIRDNTAVTVVLTRSCRGVRCPRFGDAATAISCVGGVCAQPDCVSGRELSCPPRECAGDGDCAAPASCVSAVCVDGLCVQQTDDAMCALGERCYPDVGCVDSGSCVPLAEICNGVDDDCDASVDEGFDPATDPDNCGSCGTRCSGANATASCTSGACSLVCNAGFVDCNGSAEDGCETSLNSAASCGRCATVCDPSTPLCEAMRCTADCSAGRELCGGACVDTSSDVNDCGACGTVCAPEANTVVTCVAGACVSTCIAGFARCGASCTPLTSNTNCGGCGMSCARVHATSTCATGACRVQSCSAGYGDCDGTDSNGCEAPLTTTSNCGGCGTACPSLAHTTVGCGMSVCMIQSCNAGWADCDGVTANGCETLLTTLTNCGSCGTTCSAAHATSTCASGTCTIQSCATGWTNCDGAASNGCERNTATSTSDCGGCGVSCGPEEECVGGTCTCGSRMGMPGSGRVCTAPQHCCAGDLCRPSGSICP